MTKPTNIAAIEKATARPWKDWLDFLEAQSARRLSHKDIADLVQKEPGISGWWAQNITVAYEQHIGRRLPGQTASGTFSVSVSKTLSGALDTVFARWAEHMDGRTELADRKIIRGPTLSDTDTWRYWSCGLEDGSRVSVHMNEKQVGKVILGVQHDRLESATEKEHCRAYWQGALSELEASISL